jgi:hypothetical protein
VLATAQIALTLALLATAGLSLTALYRVTDGPIGFDTTSTLTGHVSLPEARYSDPEKRRQFIDLVLRRLTALPSVTDAAVTTDLPYGGTYSSTRFWPEEVQPREATSADVLARRTSATALGLLRIPLISGRRLAASDSADAPLDLRVPPFADPDVGAGIKEIGFLDAVTGQGPQVAAVDLHETDVDRGAQGQERPAFLGRGDIGGERAIRSRA